MKELIKSFLKLSPIPFSKNHLYDIQTKYIIKHFLTKESNCIDVGCHKGEILDLMLRYAPEGSHWGFEPNPDLFNELVDKYQRRSNIHIMNYALSNRKGISTFNLVLSNPSYSGLRKRDYDRRHEVEKEIQVNTELLDNLIPVGIKIDLLKIDVEGAELLVLEGASRIISNDKPLVIFEHGLGGSDHYDSTPEKIYTYFGEHGMQVSTLSGFIKKNNPLTIKEMKDQFYNRINYYFIAHEISFS